MENETLNRFNFIRSRKSIRNFESEKIPSDIILEILECGRWAPSGLNNQPWKVCVVTHNTVKKMLADLTEYGDTIESAYVNLVIFLDLEKGYDRVKDIQAIGAFMENILLGVHAIPNLGACWIGEILNQNEKVNEIFKYSIEKFELMGVIAIGIIEKDIEQFETRKQRERRPLDDFIELF